jgi:hypothetical protein
MEFRFVVYGVGRLYMCSVVNGEPLDPFITLKIISIVIVMWVIIMLREMLTYIEKILLECVHCI